MVAIVATPPTTEPLTLQEVRVHLRQAADDPSDLANFDTDEWGDDSWVLAKITAAREYAEDFLGCTLTDAEYVQPGSAFGSVVDLPAFTTTITRVEYLDAANAIQTLSTANYFFDTFARQLFFDGTLPALSSRANAVRVYFRGPSSPVAETIKQAMLLLIGHWYVTRESGDELPTAVDDLLRPRRLRLGMA